MIKHLRSIIRYMLWLLRLWFFTRFVDKQDLKLHENMRKPDRQKFRDNIYVGYVNIDSAIVAYANARPRHRLFRKTSEGKTEKLAFDAIGFRLFMPVKDRRPHRAWFEVRDKVLESNFW